MTRHVRAIGILAMLLALAVAAPAMGSTDAARGEAPARASADVLLEPVDEVVTPSAVCALKAWSDSQLVDVIAPVAIDVLANDCLGAARPDRPLTITAVTQGKYGSVTTDGRSVIYNPTGCTLGDGGWDTFTYTMTDGVGAASSVVGVQFRRPASTPVTDIPQAGLVSGSTMGSTVPVRLSWCGVTASGSSVSTYRVLQSTNGGTSYGSTPIVTGTSTASTRSLSVNTSYRWQARTTDSKSRTGAYVPSLTSRLTRYQENSTAIRYSTGWKTASSSRYSGGKERYTTRSGATATLTVTNVRQFAIVASKGSGRGSFHVYVDGLRKATVSQRASKSAWRRVLYVGGLTSGPGVTHTIQVRSASSARIDLDAILTLSGKQSQELAFATPAPAGATYLGSAGASTATATSGLPVTLTLPATSWPVCALDGSTLSFHGVGTCTVAATGASDQTWNGAVSTQSFAVGPAPVTVTGIVALDRPYAQGDTGATLDTASAALQGVDAGDAAGVTLDASGATAAFADGNAGPDKPVQVAGLALTGDRADRYAVIQPVITATITKADQVVTFDTAKPTAAVKDGPDYTVAASSTSGLPVTVTVATSSAAVCSITGSTVSFTGSGTCTLQADQEGDENWNPASTGIQTFSVASTGTEPQAITFAQPANTTYGAGPVALTATSDSGLPVTLTPLTPGVCSTSGSAAVVLAAGTCTIEAGQPGDPVYAPAPDVTRSFTVSPKSLTVTGLTAANKVYDGLTAATLVTGSAALQGVVGSDAVSLVTTGASGTFTPNANVGSGKSVTVAGLTLSGSKAGSYTLVQPTTTASITKATLVVTPASHSIVYGAADPLFTFGYTGFVHGETSLVIETPPTCGVAGSARDVSGSPYPIACAGGLDDNYAFNLSATGTLTVSAKPVTASFTAASRAYNGTTTAAITGCSLAVIEPADAASATCSSAGAAATFATANAGTAIVVTGSGFTVTGAKAANYAITATNATTADITKAAAACTVTPYSVVYDGLPHTATGQCLGVGGTPLAGLSLAGTTHTDAGTYPSDAWAFTDVTGNYQDTGGTVSNTIAQAPQTITFTSTAPSPGYVNGTYQVTTTSTGSGNAVVPSIASGSTGTCSINGSGLVTFLAAGTCTIDATKAGTANYLSGANSQSVTVALNPQAITFAQPAGRTYGNTPFTVSATASSSLTVGFSSQTPAVCSVAGTTVTILHAGSCTIRASQAGDAVYAAATPVDNTITVAKATVTVTADNKAITYGQADPGFTFAYGAFVGTDTATVIDTAPTCTVSGAHANAGTYAIACSGGLDGDYGFGYVNGTLTINKAGQAIAFTSTAPADARAQGPTYTPTATGGGSGNPVVFTSGTPAVCTASGGVVTFLVAGTCTIQANQAGSTNYNAAPQVTQDVTVALSTQTITFAQPAGRTYGDAPFAVSATASSGLPVSLSSQTPAACSVAGTTVTILHSGSCTIRASQAGSAAYSAAADVDRTFAIAQRALGVTADSKTITYGQPDPGFTFTYGTFAYADTSAVIDTAPTCGVTGAHTDAGTYAITCSGAADNDYTFSYVNGTLTVNKASQAITFTSTAPTGAAVGDTYTPTATASSGLPVSFTASPSNRCSISGGVVTFLNSSPPSCNVTASQPGDANHNAAPTVTQSITIRDAQTITFNPPATKTYGDAPFVVTATASSNLAVTVASLTPAVCSTGGTDGKTITILHAGTCGLRASQAGNATYAPETLDRTISVAKATLAVTAHNKAITYGQPGPAFTFAYGPFVAGDDAGDIATPPACGVSGAHADAGSYPITCSGGADEDYAFDYTGGTLTVGKADQAITFTGAAPAGATVGGGYIPAATATSLLGVTFTIDASATSVCSLTAGTVHFDAVGTCVVNANQAGDGNWNPALQVQQSFAVGQAAQTITFGTLADKTYGDALFVISATASSGLDVTFTTQTSAVCTTGGTNGATVTILAAGSCTIRASQAGDADHAAAPVVDQAFTVAKRAIAVTAVTDSKTADGTTDSAGAPTITAGSLATGDTATWTQAFDTAAAGTGKTLTPAGTVARGATDVTASYAITFVPVTTGTITPGPASTATSTITASPDTITADGAATSTITVRLRDGFGNALTASGGVVALSASGGSLGAVTDNGDGTYTATYTADTTPGAVTITGTLGGDALADDATVTQTAP